MKPEINNFYNSKIATDYLSFDMSRIEIAKKILSIKKIESQHEFLIDEVYDYVSQDCFNYLLPLIVDAYMSGVFKFDGNLASKFWDTIPELDQEFVSHKFGVKSKVARFSKFYALLNSEQKASLRKSISKLEMMSEI